MVAGKESSVSRLKNFKVTFQVAKFHQYLMRIKPKTYDENGPCLHKSIDFPSIKSFSTDITEFMEEMSTVRCFFCRIITREVYWPVFRHKRIRHHHSLRIIPSGNKNFFCRISRSKMEGLTIIYLVVFSSRKKGKFSIYLFGDFKKSFLISLLRFCIFQKSAWDDVYGR